MRHVALAHAALGRGGDLMGACVAEIYASRGAWLDAPAHIAQLAALLTLCAILRHNGPALALPCIVWLMLAYPARLRRALACTLAFAALFAGVKGPLYAAFDVQSADTGITETFGLPMALLTHVYAEAPDALDADIVAYMERIAPWQTFYEHDACGDWNEVKWYVQPIDVSDYTLLQVFSYALRAARAEPQLALEALAGLWRMPLLPFGEAYWRLSPYAEGMFEAQCGGPIVPFFGRALNALARLTAEPAISWLVWNPGFFLLALMGENGDPYFEEKFKKKVCMDINRMMDAEGMPRDDLRPFCVELNYSIHASLLKFAMQLGVERCPFSTEELTRLANYWRVCALKAEQERKFPVCSWCCFFYKSNFLVAPNKIIELNDGQRLLLPEVLNYITAAKDGVFIYDSNFIFESDIQMDLTPVIPYTVHNQRQEKRIEKDNVIVGRYDQML